MDAEIAIIAWLREIERVGEIDLGIPLGPAGGFACSLEPAARFTDFSRISRRGAQVTNGQLRIFPKISGLVRVFGIFVARAPT